jgi:hypothetical protein
MPEFIDYPERPNRRDPLAPPESCSFDWTALFTALGEDHPAPPDHAALSAALMVVVDWITHEGNAWPATAGRRALAVRLVLRPEISGRAAAERLGKSHNFFSKFAAEFARRFHIVNRAQSHARRGLFQPLSATLTPPASQDAPTATQEALP